MDEVRQGLEQELRITAARLREQGWPVDSRQLAGVTPEGPPGDAFDRIQSTETREGSLLSRERLVEKMDRILGALRRLEDGSYGTCTECGDTIGSTRLRAIPEASMCVKCQERAEPSQAGQTPVRAFYDESLPTDFDERDDD